MGILGWLFGNRKHNYERAKIGLKKPLPPLKEQDSQAINTAEKSVKLDELELLLSPDLEKTNTEHTNERLEDLSGAGLLLKILKALHEYRFENSLPNGMVASFNSAVKQLEAFPASNDDLNMIVKEVLQLYENLEHFNNKQLHEGFLARLPSQIKDAIFIKFESYDYSGFIPVLTLKCIDGPRLNRFFEANHRNNIDQAKEKHGPNWDTMGHKIAKLSITQMAEAMTFLQEVAGVRGVTKILPDTVTWPARNACQLTSVEDVIYKAVSTSGSNNSTFSELVNNAKICDRPLSYLEAKYSWQQGGDAYGIDTFYVLRVGEKEYLCTKVEGYG